MLLINQELAVPKTQSLQSSFAALAFALDSSEANYPVGCNAHVLPDGAFRSDDGRPASMTGGELMDWQLNAEIAAKLIADLGNGRRPVLYDYEHRSLFGDSRAAGWIDKLVYVPGQGLFGHVDWTPDADQDIAKKIWRYSSPYFAFDPKTGAVTKLISVALTNNPALGNLGAVMLAYQAALAKALPVGALANQFLTTAGSLPGSTQGDSDMPPDVLATLTAERDGLKTQLAALTVERDAQASKLVALTAERDSLKAKVDAADQEKAQAALAADQTKHAELLQAALTDGRLVPAQKPWAEKQPLAALSEYLDATKPLPITQQQTDGKGDAGHGLSQDELAMCSRMGVTPEDFKKAKA